VATTFPLSIVLGAVDRLTGPLTRLEGRLGKFGKKATDVGKRLTFGITLPTIAIAGAALSTFASYETGMLRVQALTQATTDETSALRAQVKGLGATTVNTAGEVAGAQGFLAQAGFGVNEILGATPDVLALNSAALGDLAQTADIASNILTGYQIPVEGLGEATNVLTRTFTQSNTSLEQLGESLKLAGPIAAGMKIPFTETAAVLGAMGDAGFQASLGGTALRGALAKLAVPTGEAVRALTDLKINRDDLLDADGNVKTLIGTIRLLEQQGATTADLLTIFGQRAGPAMVALVGRGADSISQLEGRLKEGATAADIANLQMSGLAGQLKLAQSALQDLAIAVSEAGLVQFFTDVVQKTTQWIGALSKTSPQLLKVGTIVVGVMAAVGPLILLTGQAALGFQGLTTAAAFMGPALKTVGLTLLRTVIPAVWSFTVALLANPVGAIVAAVVALGVALAVLAKKNETVRKVLTMAWEAIKNVFMLSMQPMLFVIDTVIAGLKKLGELSDKYIPWVNHEANDVDVAGADVDAGAIASAALGGGAAGGGNSHLLVDFTNMPRGVQLATEGVDEDVELAVGFAMEGIA